MSTGQEKQPQETAQAGGPPVRAPLEPERKLAVPSPFLVAVSVLVSGVGIGILVGLSVTPVIGSVVGAVVALVASLLSLSQDARLGWNRNGQRQEIWFSLSNTVALSSGLFISGLVCGALLGIFWRTHNTFGVVIPESGSPLRPGSAEYILAANPREKLGAIGEPPAPVDKSGTPLPPNITALFSDLTNGGCVANAGKLSDGELHNSLVRAEPRLGPILNARKGQWSRGDLSTLYSTFLCATAPLSADEVKRIRTDPADRALGKAHPHPLVSKLSQELEDADLWSAIVEKVLGKQ